MPNKKQPKFAALLAFLLGGPGCFYLGWRRGAKATFGWLFGLSFAMASARLIEPAIFLIVVMHTYLAARAYRSCLRTNATQAGTAAWVETSPKTRRSWKQLAWTAGKNVLLAASR